MYSVRYILNKNITRDFLQEVINIKTIAWPYSYDSQLQWIKQNLSSNDIHVLLYKDKVLVAYLNLIDACIKINGELSKIYGIGNVCAIKRHEGYGKILMENINLFIKDESRMGLLFCKQPLLNFYYNLGWKCIDNERFYRAGMQDDKIYNMVYNVNIMNSKFEYFGKTF